MYTLLWRLYVHCTVMCFSVCCITKVLKEILVQPKKKILSFAHPCVVANPEEFLSSVEHKGSYTAECPECFSKCGLGLSSSKNNKKSTIKAVSMTHALYSLVFWCDAIALCEEHGKITLFGENLAIGDNSEIFSSNVVCENALHQVWWQWCQIPWFFTCCELLAILNKRVWKGTIFFCE